MFKRNNATQADKQLIKEKKKKQIINIKIYEIKIICYDKILERHLKNKYKWMIRDVSIHFKSKMK